MSYLWQKENPPYVPDSKVHEANMGPIWGRQDPGGPHVGPMNFAISHDGKQNFTQYMSFIPGDINF